MPSDSGVPSGRFLARIAAAGARPYAVRSGVYLLLGEPPRATSVLHPPAGPLPVGFAYRGPFPGTGTGAASSTGGAASAAAPPAAPPSAGAGGTTPRGADGGRRTAPAREAPGRDGRDGSDGSGGPGRRTAGPGTPGPDGAGEPPSGAPGPTPVEEAGPAPLARRSGLELPGRTERRRTFPALRETGAPAEEERRDGPVAGAGAAGSPADPVGGGDGTRKPLAPGGERAPGVPGPIPVPTDRSVGDAGPSASPGSPAPGDRARDEPLGSLREELRAAADPGAGDLDRLRAAMRRTSPTPDAPAPDPEDRESRSRGRPDEASPPDDPPAAPEPVVIRRPPREPRRSVPRSFWSSSLIRATHLRMLR